jgi:hypothetical protein
MVKAVAGYVRRHNLTKCWWDAHVPTGRPAALVDRARMWLARALRRCWAPATA